MSVCEGYAALGLNDGSISLCSLAPLRELLRARLIEAEDRMDARGAACFCAARVEERFLYLPMLVLPRRVDAGLASARVDAVLSPRRASRNIPRRFDDQHAAPNLDMEFVGVAGYVYDPLPEIS